MWSSMTSAMMATQAMSSSLGIAGRSLLCLAMCPGTATCCCSVTQFQQHHHRKRTACCRSKKHSRWVSVRWAATTIRLWPYLDAKHQTIRSKNGWSFWCFWHSRRCLKQKVGFSLTLRLQRGVSSYSWPVSSDWEWSACYCCALRSLFWTQAGERCHFCCVTTAMKVWSTGPKINSSSAWWPSRHRGRV